METSIWSRISNSNTILEVLHSALIVWFCSGSALCVLIVFSVGINMSVTVLFPCAVGHLYEVALFFASFRTACCHFASDASSSLCSGFLSKNNWYPTASRLAVAARRHALLRLQKQNARFDLTKRYWAGFSDCWLCSIQ